MTIPQLKSGFWLISLNPPQGHKHPKPSHAWLAPSLRVSPSAINSQVNTSHVFFHSSLQKVPQTHHLQAFEHRIFHYLHKFFRPCGSRKFRFSIFPRRHQGEAALWTSAPPASAAASGIRPFQARKGTGRVPGSVVGFR